MVAERNPTVAPKELLRAEAISRRFGPVQALASADITLLQGEVHVLLGENGAGKSTLAKVLSGIYPDRRDRIWIDGQPVHLASVQVARSFGIATVFQELSLIPALSVAENLGLVRSRISSPFRFLKSREDVEAARELLSAIGFDISARARVADLTQVERQIVEIAKAMIQQPRILIMDEPSSLLTAREEPLIFAALRRFTARGGAVLYVTHRLHETILVGSRVSLMRQGHIVETRTIDANSTEQDLVRVLAREHPSAVSTSNTTRGASVVKVRDLSAGRDCHGVSLEVSAGEIVGLYGLPGCGRETLVRSMLGLAKIRSGSIEHSARRRPRSPRQAALSGIVYLPSGRKERGILARRPIRENVTLGQLEAMSRGGFVLPRAERSVVTQRLRELTVDFRSMEDPIGWLSGGNQQKILFGRVLRDGVRLVILEDPTAGIDVQARAQIHRQIVTLAERGVGVLLVSNDIRETLSLCGRVHVFRGGKISATFEPPYQGGEAAILDAMMGQAAKSLDVAEKPGAVMGN
ncbi:sugar ABC transporter ATP-binding protein [Candidatus Binatus sp.]|uniref:sugar ABC transporter ATP-binding protein n=1 Tax=Candidatus Binatus sp. TaxID=2811406 RepID=UPI003BAF1243